MSVHQFPPTPLSYPKAVSTFKFTHQTMLNHIERSFDFEEMATTYLDKHGANDLIEMLGL